MITNMTENALKITTEEETKNIKMVLEWAGSKIEKIADTLHELHRENEDFQKEFERKNEIIERQLYGLRGRDYKTYRS